MTDNSNYLSTPDNYATPAQIKSTYDYAKALLYGSQQQPIHHWTQGVSNMVNALAGGGLDYGAAQKEKAALGNLGKQYMPPDPNAPPQRSFSDAPSSGGTKMAEGDMGPETNAISGIESGGRYDLLGPKTKTGDRAYGRYQVMGENIPEWTQAALGKPMSSDEFLANPQAQDAVFKHRFGQYEQKYGPEGAAKAWFAGEKGMNNPNARDQLGTSVADYGNRFRTAFAGAGGQAPGVQAISTALRVPNAQVAANTKLPPNNLPMPGSDQGTPLVNPALAPRVPQFNRENVQGVLSNPWASDAQKEQIRNEYKAQGQPVTMPYMGGNVIINPQNPTQQQYIPDVKWGTSKIGDIERQIPQIINRGGQVEKLGRPVTPAVGPRSEAEPEVAPAGVPAAPQGAPGPAPVVAAGQPQIAPTAPAAPGKPVEVASNDPSAGIPAEGPGTGTPPASTPLSKFAQAGPPPGVDPEDWAAYQAKKGFDVKTSVNEDAQKKAADFGAKKYDSLSTQAQAARAQIPNVELGLALMSDPNFHSGMLSGAQDTWARFKTAVLGDKYANAPNETFDKLMASQVLGSMKTALGGLGQVRLAEIALLNKANANRTNTDASNRAVLEVSRRGIQSIDHLDQLGQQYVSGDEVADPIDGKVLLKPNINASGEVEPRHGLDVGYDKLARKFVLDHPSFSDEEVKRYNSIFDTGRDPNQPEQAAAGKGNPQPAAGPTSIDQVQPGNTYKGWTFKGGDKANKDNWSKAQ